MTGRLTCLDRQHDDHKRGLEGEDILLHRLVASPEVPIRMDSSVNRRLRLVAQHLATAPRASPLSTVECCGIIAVVGTDPAVNILVEGLKILEARGYDSAGITTIDQRNELVTTKFASSGSTSNAIQILESKSSAHNGNVIGKSSSSFLFRTASRRQFEPP